LFSAMLEASGAVQGDSQTSFVAAEAKAFHPGDVVKGHFLGEGWYLATIEQDNGDGTYVVAWLDGDPSDRIKQSTDLKPMHFNRELQCYEEEPTRSLAEPEGPDAKLGASGDATGTCAAVGAASSVAACAHEAAQSLSKATYYLDADEGEKCLQAAMEALELFRALGESGREGLADTMRIVIAVQCTLPAPTNVEPIEAALKLAAEEMAAFKEVMDRRGEASMMLAAAKVNLMTNYKMAADLAKEAVTLLREVGDKMLEAQALSVLCQAQFLLSDPHAALTSANDALELHDGFDDKSGRAEVLHWSARAAMATGKSEDAMQRARRAVECFRKLGKRKLEASELHTIAEWCLAGGNPKKALPMAEQAVAICRHDAFRDWEARALSTFCDALAQLKQFKRAWSAVETAQAKFREVGDKKAEAISFEIMRHLHLAQKDHEKAMMTIKEEQKILREIGDKAGEMRLMHDAARVHLEGQSSEKALEALRRALDMAREAENLEEEISALRAINNVCVQSEAFLDALKACMAERALHEKTGNRREEANACMAIASAQFGLKDRSGALLAACQAQELFHEAGDTHGESRALALIARMQSARQTTQESLDAAEERLLVLRELGDTKMEAEALQELAMLHLNGGNAAEAEKLCRDAQALHKRAKRPENELEVLLLLVQALEARANESTSTALAPKALGVANEAVAISARCKSKVTKGRALFWHAKMLFWNEKFEDALREAEGAAHIFKKLAEAQPAARAGIELRDVNEEEAKALILCALLHGLFEQPEKGLKLLEKALSLARSINDGVLEREAQQAAQRIQGHDSHQEQGLDNGRSHQSVEAKPEEIPEEVD